MGISFYITRRAHWSREDGPEIAEEDWRSYINSDDELCPGDGDAVSWGAHSDVFQWERGNIESQSSNRDVLSKMLAMASELRSRVTDKDGVVYVEVSSSSSACNARKVIPRAGASLLLAIVGLVLVGAAVALQVDLGHEYIMLALAGAPLPLVALPLVTIGLVAIIVSVAFAVSSLFPWDRRCSKFAVLALIIDVLPFLVMG